MKILVISDLHLCSTGQLVGGQDTNGAFEHGWREIAPLVDVADLIVVPGDIAQKGSVDGYQRFRRTTQAVWPKIAVTVGNQDDRATLAAQLGPEHLCDAGYVQTARHMPTGSIILLDTLVPMRSEGALCATRLAWLSLQLHEARDRPVVAFMHHPPVLLGIPAFDDVALLDGREELLAVMSRHPAPVTLVAGHHHIAATGHIGGMQYCICPTFAGPSARLGLWGHAPSFAPGTNAACAITLCSDGRVDVRMLMTRSLNAR